MSYQIDPQYTGTVIRFFLIAEAIVNTIEAAFFFFAPDKFLPMILAEGLAVNPAHESLLRVFSIVLAFGINVMTIAGIPNTPNGIETRKTVYLMYAIVEAAGITFFLFLAAKGPEYSGLDPDSCSFIAKNLIGPLIGRLVALWYPNCFGKYTIVHDKKK